MGFQIGDLVNRREVEFSELKGKIIAVDAFNAIYQFLSSIRQPDGTPLMDSSKNITSHLSGLFYRNISLMAEGIKLIYVFDGEYHVLKGRTQEKRQDERDKMKEKYEVAVEEEDIEQMGKYSVGFIKLNKEMMEESKELLKNLGLPVIQSPSEAEAQCSFLNKNKDVDYVSSTDFDCLLYGAEKMVRNLTLAKKRKLASGAYITITPELIELKEVLKKLEINQDQLIVLGILVGTDFNNGVKGIGPKTALKLVKKHKNFDDLFKKVNAEFDWKQVYAVFKSMPIMKNYKLNWKSPDLEKIKKILVERHDFNEERVDKNLERLTNKKIAKKSSDLTKWF